METELVEADSTQYSPLSWSKSTLRGRSGRLPLLCQKTLYFPLILVLLRLPTFFFEAEFVVLLVEFFLAGNHACGPLLHVSLAAGEPVLQFEPPLLKLFVLIGQFSTHGFQLPTASLHLFGGKLEMIGQPGPYLSDRPR